MEDAGWGGNLILWWPARVERMCNWNNAEESSYRPEVAMSPPSKRCHDSRTATDGSSPVTPKSPASRVVVNAVMPSGANASTTSRDDS